VEGSSKVGQWHRLYRALLQDRTKWNQINEAPDSNRCWARSL